MTQRCERSNDPCRSLPPGTGEESQLVAKVLSKQPPSSCSPLLPDVGLQGVKAGFRWGADNQPFQYQDVVRRRRWNIRQKTQANALLVN